jgi:osmoprotectant transport system permease protein
MTVAPDEVTERQQTEEQAPEQEDQTHWLRSPAVRRIVRYAGMPLFIAAVLLALYLWVSGLELDSISQRNLNQEVLLEALREHLWLTVVSTLVVLLIAIPLGILATRPGSKRLAPVFLGIGNAGQAIPSLGMLAIIYFLVRDSTWLPSTGRPPVVIALVLYSFLPILRNTMVGLQQVDEDMLEAGRGMGMSNGQVLRRIELPLAVPVILAGVRTALVLNVGTATLAFLFGAGGLGNIIVTGFGLNRLPVLLTGAVMTAALALFVDYLAGLVEEWLTPEGL